MSMLTDRGIHFCAPLPLRLARVRERALAVHRATCPAAALACAEAATARASVALQPGLVLLMAVLRQSLLS